MQEELVPGPNMNNISWWKQLCTLTNRSFTNMTRDLAYYWIRILFCALIALGAGIMFFDIGLSNSSILARVKCYTYFYDFLLCLCVGGLPSLSEEWKVKQNISYNDIKLPYIYIGLRYNNVFIRYRILSLLELTFANELDQSQYQNLSI